MTEKIKVWAQENLKGDPVIWGVMFGLGLISIFVVYSATSTLAHKNQFGNTEYYLFRHTILVFLSFFTAWLAHKIDFRYFSLLSKLALWISVPLLLYAWLFGNTINDASRWITIPLINQSFQPSDLAKVALIVALASMLSKRQMKIEDVKITLVPILIWILIVCSLIAMTNMSTAILLFLTCMLLMFIGRVPVKYLALLVLVGAIAGAAAFTLGQRAETVISRVEQFLDDDQVGYQEKHAKLAIASGGTFGKGPGKSDERNFLPSAYADFIYAIILEEYGFVGGILVLILYLVLLVRGMRMVSNSEKAYEGLLSAGISFSLVLQAMVNMGVAVGLGPVTGLPLPFVSMGGTSLLFTGLAFGIMLSVSRGPQASINEGSVKQGKNFAKAA
ncbi:FtsW/RodA/SpoVE family cell cycle protein [Marinigracilibium pacificum]|uniref:Probable peptidoglycan glycosyltransferase FtsW n=1 Tax=Marinigracilibium pacificum TaxID=2729599 RepID=A0A848JAL3_9BACT|nr:FtsW/RodA/SpoVE family cell cycle protein [Marinigracilibium pacificum]NMM50082.1 FtsW/RodA/SpoVE family cell cycle protein [Marinigracilibium pacificum]